jgi:hypothetical protein
MQSPPHKVDSTFYVFGVYWLNATTIHFYANGIKVTNWNVPKCFSRLFYHEISVFDLSLIPSIILSLTIPGARSGFHKVYIRGAYVPVLRHRGRASSFSIRFRKYVMPRKRLFTNTNFFYILRRCSHLWVGPPSRRCRYQ